MWDQCGTDLVHKETRHIETWGTCYEELSTAKLALQADDHAILALDKEGGGKTLWMRDSQRDLLIPRLNKHKGCYGLWPINRLNEGR